MEVAYSSALEHSARIDRRLRVSSSRALHLRGLPRAILRSHAQRRSISVTIERARVSCGIGSLTLRLRIDHCISRKGIVTAFEHAVNRV